MPQHVRCIGNCILARAPIRPNSAWKALGVIGPSRSVIKTCEDGPCSRHRRRRARISSPCIEPIRGIGVREGGKFLVLLKLQGRVIDGAHLERRTLDCEYERHAGRQGRRISRTPPLATGLTLNNDAPGAQRS
jgi:hypothetical protein